MGLSTARILAGVFMAGLLAGAKPEQTGTPEPSSEPPQQASPADQNPPPREVLKPDPAAIQFESRGLDYSTLTRNGITVMFAQLPARIRDFNVIQVTITNGSLLTWTVRPGDFTFMRQDGTALRALSADDVVESLLESASRNDVIHLQLMYEDSIYALANYRPTNGYEKRREAAMAQFVNPRFKAAAAASAVSLSVVKLKPGESTDGAVFFETRKKEKVLGTGQLVGHLCGEQFVFQVAPEPKFSK
jgi:hypothetical protein